MLPSSSNTTSVPLIRGDPSRRREAIVACLPTAKQRRTSSARSGAAAATSLQEATTGTLSFGIQDFSRDVVVIGGCGRVGLPLGLAFADRSLRVTLFDINPVAVSRVNAGSLPFDEPGAADVLARVVGTALDATTDPACVAEAEHVIVVVGTPIDEHLNPVPQAVPKAVAAVGEHLRDGQLLVLRSTLYPGVTALVERL